MFLKMAGQDGLDFDIVRKKLGAEFAACINARFPHFCEAIPSPDGILVTFKPARSLETIEDARNLIELIEFVLFLYSIRYH
jgi:hypothetical protein